MVDGSILYNCIFPTPSTLSSAFANERFVIVLLVIKNKNRDAVHLCFCFWQHEAGFEPTTARSSRISRSSCEAPLPSRPAVLCAVRLRENATPWHFHSSASYSPDLPPFCSLYFFAFLGGGRALAVGGRFKDCRRQKTKDTKRCPSFFGCGGRI